MPEQERRQAATVGLGQTIHPILVVQYSLNHQRVDVNQADLQEVQRQHADFTLFHLIRGKVAALTEAYEVVDIVPVFNHVQGFLNFMPQFQ